MENLNDLIWTDEENSDNNDIQPQNESMYKIFPHFSMGVLTTPIFLYFIPHCTMNSSH